jgi:hypothetical protein
MLQVDAVTGKMREGEHSTPALSEAERARIRLELSRKIHALDKLKALKLAELVKNHLTETAEKNDFLLIVGNNAANEWVGFTFFPEYTFRADVIPPPTPGLRHT